MKLLFCCFAFIYSAMLIAQVNPCEVSYLYKSNDSTRFIDFQNRNENLNILSYSWDFGDGTTSDLANPGHTYDKSGTYWACLTIVTAQGCISTFCDSVQIGNTLLDTNSTSYIAGIISAGPNHLPKGAVLLIEVDDGFYRVRNVAIVDSGNFMFDHVFPGEYLMYAIPYFNINMNYFPAYLPTYSGNSVEWQTASVLHHYSSNQVYNISLYCNTDLLYGNDTLSGKILLGDSAIYEHSIYNQNWFGNIQQPLSDVAINMPVILYDTHGHPLRFSCTDESGNFIIANLPDSNFMVAPQKPGFYVNPAPVNFSSNNSSAETLLFYLGGNSFTIGVEESAADQTDAYRIYPNPFSNSIELTQTSGMQMPAGFTLYDISGRIVYAKTLSSFSYLNYKIDTHGLKPGSYYAVIRQANGSILKQAVLIKQD